MQKSVLSLDKNRSSSFIISVFPFLNDRYRNKSCSKTKREKEVITGFDNPTKVQQIVCTCNSSFNGKEKHIKSFLRNPKFLALLLGAFFSFFSFQGLAATYYSIASGDPNVLSNWKTNRDGTGSSPLNFTTTGDVFIIQGKLGQSGAPHAMTTSSTWNIGSSSGSNTGTLEIEDGATLTANDAITLNNHSTGVLFKVDNGGTYIHNNTITASSSIFNARTSFGATSNFKINNWAGVTTVITTSVTLPFGNIELNWTSNSGAWQQAWSGNINLCAGDFKITSVGTGSFRFTASGTPTVTIGGKYIQSTGTVELASTTGTTVVKVAGDFSKTGGTLQNTSSTNGTINFNGTNQNIKCDNSNKVNFDVNTGSTCALNGDFFIASANSSSFTVNGTLDCSTFAIKEGSTNGTFNFTSGNKIITANNAGLTSPPAFTGSVQTTARTYSSGANYEFQGTNTGAFTTTPTSKTVNNLTINRSGGVVLDQDITVAGVLAHTSGKLNIGSNTLTLNGTVSSMSATNSLTGSPSSNITVGGTGSLGTLFFDQTTLGTTNVIQTLTVDRQTSGTVTIGNDFVSGTSFTLTNGTVNLGTNTLTLKGTISNANGSTVTASSGTVTFGGSSAQSASAAAFTSSAFKNLNISNGNTVTINGSFSVATGGIMTVSPNTTFIPQNATDIISGAGTLTGGFSGGAVTVNKTGTTDDFASQYIITNKTLSGLLVKFVGTAPQGIGSSITSYGGVELSNSNGAVLNNSISLSSSLALTNGGLDLNGKTLTVTGGIATGSGTLRGSSTSSLVLGGTTSALNFLSGSEALKDFTLNSGSSVTLGTKLDLYNILTPSGTLLNLNSKALTLKSTASGTALIASITGSVTGASNVTMERYIPTYSNRRYRLMTAPVTNTTINASWQEGKKWDGNTPETSTGYGTLITGQQQGSAATANANGFDFWPAISNSAASIRQYVGAANSANAGYFALGNTTTTTAFDLQQAYLVFIRGDRSVYTGTTPGITTLRATGTLKQGGQTATVSDVNSHTLIGNPYPAPLDFYSFYNSGTNSNAIQADFYVWSASLGTATGGYIFIKSMGGGLYDRVPGGDGTGTTANRLIASSEGFFVMPKTGLSSPATVSFSESNKSASTPGVGVFRTQRTATPTSKLLIDLNTDVNGTKTLLDGVLSQFDNSFDQSGAEDRYKSINGGENLSLYKDNKDLIVTASPLPKNNDVLQLRLWNTTTRDYLFEFKSLNFAALGLTAVLDDNFTHTQTPISLTDAVTPIAFSITSDPASKDPLRFRILFSGGVLPLQLTSLKAAEKAGGVNVEWTVANETDIKGYEVEKSVDGNVFSKLASVAASGAQAYVSFDAQPAPVNYYRIKLLGAAGESKYSSVVKVSLQRRGEGIQLYPNPLQGNTLQVQLINKPQDVYTISLYNSAGQKLLSKTISHQGGSATETLELKNSFASGLYKVEVKNNNGEKVVQTLTLLK